MIVVDGISVLTDADLGVGAAGQASRGSGSEQLCGVHDSERVSEVSSRRERVEEPGGERSG
jgi:hypothetical protein